MNAQTLSRRPARPRRPAGHPLLRAAVLALTLAAAPAAAQPPCGDTSLVERDGAGFKCGSQPYRFIGVNIPRLVNAAVYGIGNERTGQLASANDMGARVIRTFLPSGRDAQDMAAANAIQRLTELLDTARGINPDLKFIVVLVDYYNQGEELGILAGDFAARAYDPNSFPDPKPTRELLAPSWFLPTTDCAATPISYSCHYEPFVRDVVTAFKDDERIFAWELGNELAIYPTYTGPTSRTDVMAAFVEDMADKIKNVWMATQMVTTGFISVFHATGGDTTGTTAATRFYGAPGSLVDFATVHGYNGSWDLLAPGGDGARNDVDWLATSAVPFVVEEIGFTGALSPLAPGLCTESPIYTGGSWRGIPLGDATYNRSPHLRIMMAGFFDDLHADGFMQWGFNSGGDARMSPNACVDMDNFETLRAGGTLDADNSGHADWYDLVDSYRCQAANFDVTAPDLFVADVRILAGGTLDATTKVLSVTGDTPVQIEVTLHNGRQIYTGPARVGLWVGGSAAATATVMSSSIGNRTVILEWTPDTQDILDAEGLPEIQIRVNDDGAITNEINCNNMYRQRVAIAPCPTPGSSVPGLATRQGICLPPGGRPDLVARITNVPPVELFAGNEVFFTSRIDNTGVGATGSAFTARWLVDGVDTGIGASYAPLGALGSVTGPDFFWTAVAGTPTVAFQVDPEDRVDETDDLINNLRSLPLTVTPNARPDLQATNITYRAADLIEGQTVLFDSGVYNGGDAASPGFDVLWRLDGEEFGARGGHDGVPARTTVLDGNSELRWVAVAGTYTLEFSVDAGNTVDEASELNNRRQVTFTVQPLPRADLKPTQIRFDRAAVVVGGEVSFDSGVSNGGKAGTDVFNVRWLVDGQQVGAGSHAPVAAGATVLNDNSQLTWRVTEGQHTITFEVDFDNQVEETNEGNNQLTVTIGTEDGPDVDLQTTTIAYTAAELYAGNAVLFDSGVKNAGSAASGPFNVRWRIDGQDTGFYGQHVGVPGGATVPNGNSQFVWNALPGTHTIAFLVDADNHVPETNEGNNQRILTVVVPAAPKPDVKPTLIRWNAADLVSGRTVLFDSGVANGGPGDAGPFNVRWLVDGLAVASGSHGPVPAGATVLDGNSQLAWTAVPGSHTVTIVVDADNHLAEVSESNNQTTITVSVAAAPRADLKPTAIRFPTGGLVEGSTVLFDSGVQNAGQGDGGGFNVRWLVDGLAVASGGHALVPAGATVLDGNSQLPWTAAAGAHTIAFFVDSDNHVPETSETNNQRQVTVQVAPAPVIGPFNVSAQVNVFAAGAGGSGGVGGGGVPQTLNLPAGTGRVLTFTVAGGALSCCGTAGAHGADGGANLSTFISSAGGISGVRHHSRNIFLTGVFLGPAGPGAAPALLQYYDPQDTGAPTAGAVSTRLAEYPAPALGQSFFVGDGLAGAGQVQRFRVPDSATRLFLGFADGLNLGHPGMGTPSPAIPGFYGDNTGTLTVTVRVGR